MIIQFFDVFKVFGTWDSSYTGGPKWRLNSGIVEVEEDSDCYYFHGHSGSVYACRKDMYGTNPYGIQILDSWKKDLLELKPASTMKVLDDKDWVEFFENK